MHAPPIPYRSLGFITLFLTGLLALYAFASLAEMVGFFVKKSGTSVLLLPVCGGTLLVWLARANRNARALGAAPYMKFTPGWSVGFFFVPVLALWKPYQAMKEIWQVSSPSFLTDSGSIDESSTMLLVWWWSWLGGNVLAYTGRQLYRAAWSTTEIAVANSIGLFGQALEILAAVLLIVVVRSVTARQEARAALQVALPSAQIAR